MPFVSLYPPQSVTRFVSLQAAHLDAFPLFFPVPSLDGHVVTSSKDDAGSGVYGETPNVVGMRLECRDFFMRVVIEDTQLKVVGTRNEPTFSSDESTAANWDFCDFECLHEGASLVVVYADGAVIETRQEPWLRGMEINCFNAVGSIKNFTLGVVRFRKYVVELMIYSR